MVFYALCVVGWIVLWFKPDWRWLAVVTAIAISPTILFYGYAAYEMGVGIRGTIINMINHLPLTVAIFALPGAAIVALRKWMLSRDKGPAQPS